MVYKIRNKSFFWTKTGWKNNYFPKSFNMPRPTNSEQTQGVRTRMDHNSFLRAHHGYRNISRHCKQYFYGDKRLEETFILGLRTFFIAPLVADTPVELIKHGAERRLVDQLDRDFELVSYNTHPFQLFTYEVNNRYIQKENEEYEVKLSGKKSYSDEVLDYIDHVFEQEHAKLAPGEKLSLEKTTSILLHIFRKARAQEKRPSQDTRGPDGEINDYLEVRRPFINPTQTGAGH